MKPSSMSKISTASVTVRHEKHELTTRFGGRPAEYYRRPRCVVTPYSLLVTGAFVAVLSISAFGSTPCLPDCVTGPVDNLSKVQAACQDYATRVDRVKKAYNNCIGECERISTVPGLAGRCGVTKDCLLPCRRFLATHTHGPIARLRRDIRKICSTADTRCAIDKRTARLGCANVPPAPSTTTTTTVPAGTVPAGGTTTTLASRAVTSWTTTPTTPQRLTQAEEDDKDCSPACVSRVLNDCFEDCADACDGDSLAFKFCRGACRNRHCTLIMSSCDCEEGVDCEVRTNTTTTEP